jgi:polyisoprenoid-binding protein YceI
LTTSIIKIVCLAAIAAASLAGQDEAIDTKRSTIVVHVGKAGLFSAAGHEHWVNAPISTGTITDSDTPQVEFRVDAARLEVKRDPKVDAKTQAEIQKDMQELTLESAKYPDITFRSSRVEKQADGPWRVEGMLTLHGVTRPVAVVVRRNASSYAGHVIVRQTDFGITPISVGGGLVKVKNEVEIDFQISTQLQ